MILYEIRDNTGIIHDFADVHQADKAWDAMIMSVAELMDAYNLSNEAANDLQTKYQYPYQGDLKLVQVHRIYK